MGEDSDGLMQIIWLFGETDVVFLVFVDVDGDVDVVLILLIFILLELSSFSY